MKRSTALVAGVIAVFGTVAGGASAHSDPTPPAIAAVGPLRVVYPGSMHRRYFSSCSYAVTGDRSGACVRGVVVASYPLNAKPELGAPGAHFPNEGVAFELYRSPRQRPYAPTALPLSLGDFHVIGRGRLPRGQQQREVFFHANGANYWAMVWIGDHATKADRAALASLITSIHAK